MCGIRKDSIHCSLSDAWSPVLAVFVRHTILLHMCWNIFIRLPIASYILAFLCGIFFFYIDLFSFYYSAESIPFFTSAILYLHIFTSHKVLFYKLLTILRYLSILKIIWYICLEVSKVRTSTMSSIIDGFFMEDTSNYSFSRAHFQLIGQMLKS